VWTHPLPGGGISLLFEDVSDRLERERELARLAAEAEEASRAKSRFFAAVSHELRTPLNAIVGYTHLLGTGTYGGMPDGAERAAERAGVCAEHLARLVDDVLLLTTTELSRLPVSPRPVPLEALLPSVLTPLQHQAEAKGLAFSLDLPTEMPALETDPERLRQLLQALVSNAIKFTSRGAVHVAVRAVTAWERPSELRAAGRGREVPAVEISVSDTGPGIAPEDRERIFDAFEQLGDPARHDSMSRGTGLGLTIARQLARLLRGTLEVDGAPGEGSVFRLRIPRVFGAAIR
jgi:signal transduction histidine kinase